MSEKKIFIPKQKPSRLKVLGICGSLRQESLTWKCLEKALEGAEERSAEIELINLRDFDLGFCGQDQEGKDIELLRKTVKESQGLIWGSPEYHGCLSGVLKNALDWMSFDEIEGKMIGLVGVSGGQMGAVGALAAMRNIGRVLHGWVVPHEASVSQVAAEFDASGKILNPATEERLKEVGRQVARFANLHNVEHAAQFLESWEESTPNPGGGESV